MADEAATSRPRQTTALTSATTRVKVQRGRLIDRAGKVHVLDDETIVGSGPDCDLFVEDSTVSRRHFSLSKQTIGYLIRDLGSTNGTFVDDVHVKEGYLRPGAVISAGNHVFRFDAEPEPAEILPSRHNLFGALLGQSLGMREIFGALERVAGTEATVLIQGDTGTGKGAVARAVHEASRRREGPFVVFDCAAVAPNLLESELFGHERGAFTGAVKLHVGALEAAAGGTLFIDELSELSLELQPKLLRALEEREFYRVGSRKPMSLDCRIIAATQRDLWAEVNAERFRRDLYFRLAVVTVPLPSLAERKEDIPLLVARFLKDFKDARIQRFDDLADDLRREMLSYDWPGNIRELRNVVERICVMDNPRASWGWVHREGVAPASTAPSPGGEFRVAVDYGRPFKDAKDAVIDAFEREYLVRLLERAGHNIAQAARDAGVNRTHLYTLLAKHGLGGSRDG